jgi:hypothetical protein
MTLTRRSEPVNAGVKIFTALEPIVLSSLEQIYCLFYKIADLIIGNIFSVNLKRSSLQKTVCKFTPEYLYGIGFWPRGPF